MIDYYADWCISCIELEHGAFKNPDAIALLKNHQLLQIDLTDNNEAEALLDRFNLQGPPSILFFDKKGQELAHTRIYAYKDEDTFLKHLRSIFNNCYCFLFSRYWLRLGISFWLSSCLRFE